MKIKEVRIDKLFSLEKYNNERIGFTVEVTEQDNADQITGELYFKICNIEDCLETYRRLLQDIDTAAAKFEDTRSIIRRIENQITNMKTTIAELLAKAEKGDIDAKLKHACDTQSYKQLTDQLKDYQAKLKYFDEIHGKLVEAKEELKRRIKQGNFSLYGLDIPILSRESLW
jgi:predicted  nucleic acid-binding Zn-ribbon protein